MPTSEQVARNPIGITGDVAAELLAGVTATGKIVRDEEKRQQGLDLSDRLIRFRYRSEEGLGSEAAAIQSARDLTGGVIKDGDLMSAQDAVDRWTGMPTFGRGIASRHIALPFAGFDGTWVESLMDIAIESFDADFDGDAAHALDNFGVYRDFAKLYALNAQKLFSKIFGMPVPLEFSFIDYSKGFRADRIFALISPEFVAGIFSASAADGHRVLADIIAEECTSTDGYVSFYDPDIELYTSKDVRLWDHNELTWLTEAALELKGYDWSAIQEELQTSMTEQVYYICEQRTDWTLCEAEDDA